MRRSVGLFNIFFFVLLILLNNISVAQDAAKDFSKIDRDQKIAPVRVTALTGHHNQLLYFTSTSLLNDDRHLIFMSDLDGNPNIFMRDMLSGKEIQLPEGWKRYGHFTEGGAGMLVTDGYYTEPDDNLIPKAPKSGLWISFLMADWDKKQLTWYPLCRNGSSWRTQDEHPHPIFNHASDAVYFTSDKDGKRAVYKVMVPLKKPL